MDTESQSPENPVPIEDFVSLNLEMGIFKGGHVWHVIAQKNQVKKQRVAAGLCGTVGILTRQAIINNLEMGTFSDPCIDCQYMFNSKLRAPDIQFNGPVVKSLDSRKI